MVIHQDPGSPLMGLVCCRESSGGVAWTSEQAASSKVQAGRKQPPSGSGQRRRGGPCWVSHASSWPPLWAATDTPGKQTRKCSWDGVGGWDAAWAQAESPFSKAGDSCGPGLRVRAVLASPPEGPVVIGVPSVPKAPTLSRVPAGGLRSQPARKAKVFWARLQLTALLQPKQLPFHLFYILKTV